MGELGVVNSDGAVLKEEERLVWSLGTTPPPDPASFSEDCLSAAEEAVAEVVNCIHPTLDSDENRRDVNDHLQKLIKTQLNCEVFPYGSVPLKTYLPDGDIDSTVLKGPNVEDSLAHDVLAVLKKEEHKEDTDYQVMDTQFIDAEALFRFLDYYSQFDWDNYCISLKGPVRKSSLPNILVKLPNSGWDDLLLGEEFMENCMEMISIPYRGSETKQEGISNKTPQYLRSTKGK